MKLTAAALFLVAGLLSGCGSSTKEPSVWVHCHDTLVLSGAKSVDVIVDPARGPLLSYPDPANPGQTGTIAVSKDNACTIAPTGSIVG